MRHRLLREGAERAQRRERSALHFKRLNRRLQHVQIQLEPLFDRAHVGDALVEFFDVGKRRHHVGHQRQRRSEARSRARPCAALKGRAERSEPHHVPHAVEHLARRKTREAGKGRRGARGISHAFLLAADRDGLGAVPDAFRPIIPREMGLSHVQRRASSGPRENPVRAARAVTSRLRAHPDQRSP